MNDMTPEVLKQYREDYPKKCYKCGGDLGGPGSDEDLIEMVKEHDGLFPGESLSTSEIICDQCFLTICPGGKLIGMN